MTLSEELLPGKRAGVLVRVQAIRPKAMEF
jgi:hypothetical protein